MKNPVIIAAMCAALVCTTSCVMSESSRSSHETELGYLADNLVSDVIVAPVMALIDCITQEQDIFTPGFTATVNGLAISLVSPEDSTWTVTSAFSTDKLQMESSVRMLPPNSEGLSQWLCSGSGTYLENSNYKATVQTLTPAGMHWVNSRTATTFTFDLCMSGVFRVTTYLRSDDSEIDRCSLTYNDSKLDDYYRTYELVME